MFFTSALKTAGLLALFSLSAHAVLPPECGPLFKIFSPTPEITHLFKEKDRSTAPSRGSKEELADIADLLARPLPEGTTPTLTDQLSNLASEKLSPSEQKAFNDWLLGQFAEDPRAVFEDQFLGRQKSLFPGGPLRYNQNGERPFDGYLAARKLAESLSLDEIELPAIQKLHQLLMSRESHRDPSTKVFQEDQRPARNSQGLKDSELGAIRSENIGFEVGGKYFPSGFSAIGKPVTDVVLDNPFIQESRPGFISYVPLTRWRYLDNRFPLSPELVKKLIAQEKKHGLIQMNQDDPELNEVRRAFIEELSQKFWDRAKTDVKKAKTHHELIEAVAEFQKNFVSIHPFIDGNGRVTRLLTEKLLNSRGANSPTYSHWGEDLSLTQAQLSELLARSIHFSEEMQIKLKQHLENKKNHSQFLNPALEAQAKEILGDPLGTFDSERFLKWLEPHREDFSTFEEAVTAFHKAHPEGREENAEFKLWRQDQSDLPLAPTEQLAQFKAWQKSLTYDDKSGSIRLAPAPFQQGFGRLSASQKEYDEKLNQHYENTHIFRGVPTDKYLSDFEMLELFTRLSPFAMGNGVSSSQGPTAVLPVFQQYNLGLLRDPNHLIEQVTDHSDGTSQAYFSSGMVSFSETESVGRHWQRDPAYDYGLLFRANKRLVGVINTAKDTDKIESLGLTREREEALIGGTDPESIQAVELRQFRADPKTGLPARVKRAERMSFNQIKIIEESLDIMDKVTSRRESIWEVGPQGQVKQIKAHSTN